MNRAELLVYNVHDPPAILPPVLVLLVPLRSFITRLCPNGKSILTCNQISLNRGTAPLRGCIARPWKVFKNFQVPIPESVGIC